MPPHLAWQWVCQIAACYRCWYESPEANARVTQVEAGFPFLRTNLPVTALEVRPVPIVSRSGAV